MNYYDWRNAVFNQPIQTLEEADCESEAFTLGLAEALDHIDRALMDDGMYSFKEEQLVIGFSLIYGKTFTDYPWCYTRLPNEERRIQGILNLRLLYSRYFLKYCSPNYLNTPGHLVAPLSMDHLCFNFWDRFSLFPSPEIGPRSIHAGLDVMESALALPNDNIIVSVVGALCCWAFACKGEGIDRPTALMQNWLANPTTKNIAVVNICEQMIGSLLD
ncbi:MAG: hypothetical protein NTY15_12200 [Planctomycetota bacterium]|nr:hypothetical protein [Planctomycetota bacterium]